MQNLQQQYAEGICRNVQKEIFRNVQKYAIENLHKYAIVYKNMMQKICNNMHIYAYSSICNIYKNISSNMAS